MPNILYLIPTIVVAAFLLIAAFYAYYYISSSSSISDDDDDEEEEEEERREEKKNNKYSKLIKFNGTKTITIVNPNFLLTKFWIKTTEDFRIIFLQGNSLYSYILGGVSEGKFVYVYCDSERRMHKTKSRISVNDGVWHLIDIRRGVSIYIDGEHVNDDLLVPNINYFTFFIDKTLYLGGIDENKYIGKLKFNEDTKPDLTLLKSKMKKKHA